MAAKRVDAAARTTDVTEQQLHNCGRTDNLCAEGVMGPTYGVDNGADLLHVAVFANRSVEVSGLEELLLGDAGDALDHLRGVAGILLLEQLEDAVGILECWIKVDSSRQRREGGRLSRVSGRRSRRLPARTLIVPACAVVGLFLGIDPGEQAVDVRKLEIFFYNESGVGVMGQVVFGDSVVFDGVVNQAAEERDIRPCADLAEHVSDR